MPTSANAALMANVVPGIAVNLASFTYPATFDRMAARDGEVTYANLIYILAPVLIGTVASLMVAFYLDAKYREGT